MYGKQATKGGLRSIRAMLPKERVNMVAITVQFLDTTGSSSRFYHVIIAPIFNKGLHQG